ncbi:alpha amylase C-terminal domain-containing protein [Actinomadura barringtoniae]|uniref:Alpha-amylase n=1 Tax=Actinomadura barringtoniae TaxID=1427535 RepID=A0A939PHU9_9ACTN|nr:alpha-amylase family glycosyl hydrolase [Actinomadura barringtoniae]MBO2448816.1 alpha amylase C-terminal domain-containing protein [Actinomadura barringtoniae]
MRRPRAHTLLPIAALALATLAAAPTPATAAVRTATAVATQPNGDAVANLWEWNWRSVTSECTDRLGPAGFGGVQVAPPAESVSIPDKGHPWWEVYQPVSYKLESRFGTRAEFAAMATACHNAGVRVIADTVVNHMAGSNNTVTSGYAGSTFDPSGYAYPAVPYTRSDFHHPGDGCPTSSGGINDWNDATQVQNCELVSLSDLYTQKDEVRAKIATYLNDLVSLGVDGFRVDAAKHVPQADFAAILAKVGSTTWQHTRPYVAQEVMPGGSGVLAPSAFEENGSLLDFVYAYKMKEQFNGDIANLKTFGTSWGIEPSDKSYAMITNHDLERNGSTLTYKDASYKPATYFMLAWPHGVPQVYDGFTFSNNDASPPADSSGKVTDANCSSWQCVHRDQGVVGLVGWRNTAGTAPVANWSSPASNVIAFSRGAKGWLAINNSASPSTATYTTGLPDGGYCDVVTGTATTSGCTGTKVTVSGGQATVTVPAKSAVALHVNATTTGGGTTPPPTTTTTVYVHKDVGWGNRITIRGSVAPLSWSTGKDCVNQSAALWKCTIDGIPSGTSLEYKPLINDTTWSTGANFTTTAGQTTDIYPTF